MSRARAVPATSAEPASRSSASAVALRAFFNIAEKWQLAAAEQRVLLGSPPSSTFFKWKKERLGPLPRDVLERISYVLGIYKALQILLPDPARADAWVRQPNTGAPFGGGSALDRMMGGNVGDLYAVREYLDAQRG